MKNLDKIKLIDMIASELQDQMTFSEIDSYFKTYDIPTDHQPSYNSKRVYVKEVLPKINDEVILQIADELNLDHTYGKPITQPQKTKEDSDLWKPGHFRLFLSHLASFKVTISHLKVELEKFGISSFVAHEDIEPTKEWQTEIEKGLFSMDALCAILMPGFNESKWTDQEVGVAIGREVLIIPVRRDLDPYGFIGKYQGIQAKGKNIGQVADSIFNIICSHPKTKALYISSIVDLLLLSTGTNEIQDRINAINQVKDFPIDKVEYIKNQVLRNPKFNNIKSLKALNDFFALNRVKEIDKTDFVKPNNLEYDELPF